MISDEAQHMDGNEDRVARALAEHADALAEAHGRAMARGGGFDTRRVVGGRTVRLRLAGARLVDAVWLALSHLPEADAATEDADWTMLAWDEAETGVARAVPPWREPAADAPRQRVLPPGGEQYRIPGTDDPAAWMLADLEQRRGFWVTPDARALPTHHGAAPFLLLWHWWAGTAGLRLLHAGCVGTDAGALLLAGAGGAGKSTTALLGALGGLDYLSDDYCLVRTGGEPEAFALFGTGKLHRDHLARFPELAKRAVDPGPDVYRKPVIHVGRAWPGRVVVRRPIRAVVTPRVVGAGPTRTVKIGPAEALRALAPSTLMQLPGAAKAGTWGVMAELVRRVPCYRLELGGNTGEVAPALRELIEALR